MLCIHRIKQRPESVYLLAFFALYIETECEKIQHMTYETINKKKNIK